MFKIHNYDNIIIIFIFSGDIPMSTSAEDYYRSREENQAVDRAREKQAQEAYLTRQYDKLREAEYRKDEQAIEHYKNKISTLKENPKSGNDGGCSIS